ncbi:MAG: hypothetical protein ABI333_27160 [bacterium]
MSLPDPAGRGALRRFLFTWIALGLYGLSLALTPWFGLPAWLGLAVVFGLGLPAVLLVAQEWSAHRPGRSQAAVLVAAGAITWLTTALLVRAGQPWWIWQPCNGAALLVTTYVVGNWLAGELERPGHLVAVCVIGALADLWSATAGPTRELGAQVQQASLAAQHVQTGLPTPPPPLVSFLILWWPVPGGGGMVTLIGFGDLVFFALLLAAAQRFALPRWRGFFLVLGGVALSIALAAVLSRPLPALPAIGALFVLGNLGRLPLRGREWLVTAGVAVTLGLFALLWALR